MRQLTIALLLTMLLATYVSAAPVSNFSVMVQDGAGQPVGNQPVALTAGEGRQKVVMHTNEAGIADFANVGSGDWVAETCGQSLGFATVEEPGPGGLWIVTCHRLLLPMAVK